jgi:hypothetical protein
MVTSQILPMVAMHLVSTKLVIHYTRVHVLEAVTLIMLLAVDSSISKTSLTISMKSAKTRSHAALTWKIKIYMVLQICQTLL